MKLAPERNGYILLQIMAAGDAPNSKNEEYEQYLDERARLIDAARESLRTFDKAILTFGAAIFGFSIAFLKDVAPNPETHTLKWLGLSWVLFSFGLLAILLSFLFSHRACLFDIEVNGQDLNAPNSSRQTNLWSVATSYCNGFAVFLLFLGILCWSIFAFDNIGHGETTMNKVQTPGEKKGYVPPPPPVKSTPQPPPPPTSQPSPKK